MPDRRCFPEHPRLKLAGSLPGRLPARGSVQGKNHTAAPKRDLLVLCTDHELVVHQRMPVSYWLIRVVALAFSTPITPFTLVALSNAALGGEAQGGENSRDSIVRGLRPTLLSVRVIM